MAKLAQAQNGHRLVDVGGPVAQGEVGGIHDPQQAVGQAGIHGDNLLDLIHLWLVLGHRHQQAEEIALQIAGGVDGGKHLLGGISPAQGVRPQNKRLLVQLLRVHPGNHALLPHAVNHFRQTADAGVPRVGQVHHHVVKLPQVGNEPG